MTLSIGVRDTHAPITHTQPAWRWRRTDAVREELGVDDEGVVKGDEGLPLRAHDTARRLLGAAQHAQHVHRRAGHGRLQGQAGGERLCEGALQAHRLLAPWCPAQELACTCAHRSSTAIDP